MVYGLVVELKKNSMKIIYNNYLPFKGFRAMSIYPIGVFVRNTDNVGKPISKTTVRHESIHWQQQKELLGIFFYVFFFLIEFVWIQFCSS